ncbi:unnamed protein product [Brassicogethes aeneus]|uniref:PHD-type domain-containing protein n=1 Tax=Brassicogethes aeneus TaxID=1431903 RepID=A0A9P0FDG2_BRAAE|nr:unnamed protein product [Brassicogethes aeneus]
MTKLICNICNNNINKSGYKIQCAGQCKSWHHLECTELSAADVKKLEKREIEWKCEDCKSEVNSSTSKENTATINDILMEIRLVKAQTDHITTLKDEIKELQKTIQFLSDQYDDQKKLNEEYEKTIKNLKKENNVLKKDVEEIKRIMLKQEVGRRSQNLVIMGVDSESGNNKQGVSMVLHKVMQDFHEEHIKEIIKVNKTEENKVFIVKLESQDIRDRIMEAKKKIKKLTNKDCGINENDTNTIFINEDLPYEIQAIFRKARALKKENEYKFVWCKNGQISARKDENSNKIKINSIEDVENLQK